MLLRTSFTISTFPIIHPVCTPPPLKNLHNLCFPFPLGIILDPRETEDNAYVACVAGVEGEGMGKKQRAKRVSERGALLLSSLYSRGRFDPFPPFLRLATQANAYAIFWGTNKVYYGGCGNGE